MSVGTSATPIPDQSFEELRIQDYLKAYQTTGRLPPAPCPQSPDTPNARAALGLPPLFVPAAIPIDELGGSGTSTRQASIAPIALPADLPANHDFRPYKLTATEESFECISAQPLYKLFSHEELRYHAYLSGNKMPPNLPATIDSSIPTTISFTSDPSSSSSSSSRFYAHDAPATAFFTSTTTASGPPDYLMSIVASLKFEKHSFEELRIAYLLAGKEVGSSEIPTRGALPAQAAPTLFGRPRGDAFSSGSLRHLQ